MSYCLYLIIRLTPSSTLFPYTTLFRSSWCCAAWRGGRTLSSAGVLHSADSSGELCGPVIDALRAVTADARSQGQIGRASCRERGWMWGVGGGWIKQWEGNGSVGWRWGG